MFISSDITFSGYKIKVCHDITIQLVIIFGIYRAGWNVVNLRLKIANFHSDWAAYSLLLLAIYEFALAPKSNSQMGFHQGLNSDETPLDCYFRYQYKLI